MTKPGIILSLAMFIITCQAHRPGQPASSSATGAARVVAVGDVHGDLEGFTQILRRADLIDEGSRWIGGKAVLVQTGDLLDRGSDIRQVLDLLIELQRQAPSQGGRVIVTLGNHEAIHLVGDFQYVAQEAYAAFVDPESQTRRDRAFAAWAESTGQEPGPEIRKRWMDTHPMGSLEYRKAFGPQGRYGKWLRDLPVVAEIQGILFMHGGIGPKYLKKIDVLNRLARQQIDRLELLKKGQTRSSLGGVLFDPDGPLWFRGAALWEEPRLGYLKKWLGQRRLVAGHTINPKGEIQSRLSGRVYLIDTGMALGRPGGQASALEFDGGRVTAIYQERYQVLAEPGPVRRIWPGPDGGALPFASHDEALKFLRTARVVNSEEYKDGVNLNYKLVLEKDGVRALAIFRFKHDVEEKPFQIAGGRKFHFRDSFRGELAAYRLARLLDMHNLPPTVERQLEGRPGSVQLWLEGCMTEHQRQTQEIEPPNQEHRDHQMGDMRVFDNLINNSDRHPKNILFDRQWNLWMIDHTRAFGKDHYLPLPLTLKRCSPGLWRALKRLDELQVRARLKPYLSADELDALMARHAKLIQKLARRLKKGRELQPGITPAAVP